MADDDGGWFTMGPKRDVQDSHQTGSLLNRNQVVHPMRGTVSVVLVCLLSAMALAGCVADEPDPVQRPRTQQAVESLEEFAAANAAARDEVGSSGGLVAAIGLASARPDQHEAVSSNFPGMASIVDHLTARPSAVPGTGSLPAWAFIFDTGGSMTFVVALKEDGSDSWTTTQGSLEADELVLIRAQGEITMPDTPPGEALEAALENDVWATVSRATGIFVLYVLSAGETGEPEWKMIISTYNLDPPNGVMVRVDGVSGELKGSSRTWPEEIAMGGDVRDGGSPFLPGDVMEFTVEVDQTGHPMMNVLTTRTGTGTILGDPEAEIRSPSGEAVGLTYGEWDTVSNPEPGEWTVVYTWDMVDIFRTIRVEYCLQPVPFLLAERVDVCD